MISLESLLRVPYVDPYQGFDISPDGKRLAFSYNETGQWEIYELLIAASDLPLPNPQPSLLTEVQASGVMGAKFTPRYSPDGLRLAYVADFDGGENFHLFVHDLKTGAHTDLTPDIDFALQPNFCWSPDGTQIAFLSDQNGDFDAYILPSAGGVAQCVLANGHPAWDVQWSPDGAWLAVAFESTGQDYAVHLLSFQGDGSFVVLDGDKPLNAHNPSWSPDSTQLAFHSDAPNGFHQIGLFDIASREITWLTAEEANCLAPDFSKDGSMLVYLRAQGASDEIVIRSMAGRSKAYRAKEGVHHKPLFTPDGKELFFVFNNPLSPPDVWRLTLENGSLSQLTHSLPDKLKITPGLFPEELTYPGLDGTPIPALLFKPPETDENTTAVIVVHGGPNWHYQMEWHPFMVHLASRGWSVLAPNYRGSTGYGRNWQYANHFNLGSIDTDDVAAGAHFLVLEKLADPAKIAITGRSHGGYLTLTCLTSYPELWRAGSGVVPFTNWFTCHERSRSDLQHWDIEMMGDPIQNHARWHERSPYFFLNRINAPVQLICGAHDPRCPAEDSIDARDQLLQLGKQVEFHLYEDEGHTFLKTDNIIRSEVQRVEFLARHLEP